MPQQLSLTCKKSLQCCLSWICSNLMASHIWIEYVGAIDLWLRNLTQCADILMLTWKFASLCGATIPL